MAAGGTMAKPTETFFAAVGRCLMRFDLTADGRFAETDSLNLPCNVQYACLDPANSRLYAGCSNGGVASIGDFHCLVVVSTGERLRPCGSPVPLPCRPIHLSLGGVGQRLLIAYNLPAAVTVHPLDGSGHVRETIGPFCRAQGVGWFPHQILPMPGSEELLLTCRGDDATAQRPENPGSLRIVRIENGRMRLRQIVAPRDGLGFGPRNCAFHPTAPWLYVVLERQNRLAMFRRHGSVVDADTQYHSSLLERPERWVRPQLGGDIKIHPDGGFAFVANRSHAVMPHAGEMVQAGGENSIATFSLDSSTGEPRLLDFARIDGLHARCLTLAHGGSLLVATVRQASLKREAQGVTTSPAGFSIFSVARNGHLGSLGHHPIDVGGEQLFWSAAA